MTLFFEHQICMSAPTFCGQDPQDDAGEVMITVSVEAEVSYVRPEYPGDCAGYEVELVHALVDDGVDLLKHADKQEREAMEDKARRLARDNEDGTPRG